MKDQERKPLGRPRLYTPEERVELNRARNRAARANFTQSGQEIGPIPEVKDWSRREACMADPERFMRVYFGQRPYFYTPFCDDHRKIIAKFEDGLRNGGLFALACPRGHGKTSLCRAFVIRAIATGMRQFALLVGAASAHARRSMEAIKSMMVGTTMYDPEKKCLVQLTPFAEDFPEIVFPAAALGRTINRQKGQACLGMPTSIHWSGEYIRLPSLPQQPSMRSEQHRCGGAICFSTGLLGSAGTGMNIDGVRPDLVVLDDVQTRESAVKDAACAKREEIINAMVTGLAGAGVRIAAVMPCTVIREGDLSDRFLSHSLHPEWAVERTKLLSEMPKNMDLWRKNKEIRGNYNPWAGPEDKKRAQDEATLHYIDNQAAMDEGAIASWPERYNPDEVSAIQNAMNLFNENETAFWAEMQNKPKPREAGNIKRMTADEIAGKLSGVPHREVPFDAGTMTAFIDVQKNMLYYCVCAWCSNFTGYVVDYGTFPDQKRSYFTKSEAPRPLGMIEGAPEGEEPRLVWALTTLVNALMGAEWPREKTHAPNRIDLCLIDSGSWSQLVYQFCRRSPHRVLPSKGMHYDASSRRGMGEGKVEVQDKRGYHWHLPAAKEERGVKLLLYDANPWKSFVRSRLLTPAGAAGCLSLFGDDPASHRLFADHQLAEYCDSVTNDRTQRTVEVWKSKHGHRDNDFLDALVGATVAASVAGVVLEGVQQEQKPKRGRRMSIAELKAKRESERLNQSAQASA